MKQIDKSLIQKNTSFLYYYHWLKLIALTMIQWEDLPVGCDSDFIEKILFEKGRVIFAKHPDYGIINLSLAENYERNVYDKPIIFEGVAGDFKYKCDWTNSIIVQNNILNIPTMPVVAYFADKISRIDRVYDVNLLGQKTPLIFEVTPQEKFTLEQIINDIYSDVPILKTNEKLNLNNKVNVLETKVPYLLDKLRDDKTSCMAEFLTFIGIKNVNITKKERLITSEAESNTELTEIDLDIFLSKRQEAVKQINSLFGTNIKVSARKDMIEKVNEKIKLLQGGKDDTSKV